MIKHKGAGASKREGDTCMKNRLLKVLALMMLLALAIGAIPALADYGDKASIEDMDLYAGCGDYLLDFDENWTWCEEIISVKSSKPDIIAVPYKDLELITPKKPGKSKITVKYKYEGKKYTISKTLTVKEYPNPVKSLTFNGKKVPLKGNKKVYYTYTSKKHRKNSATINLQPNSGWKISQIKAWKWDVDHAGHEKAITVKNNKKFTLAADWDARVVYTLKNKKGQTFIYTVIITELGE